MSATVESVTPAAPSRCVASELSALSKFRLTSMVAVAAGVGLFMAWKGPWNAVATLRLVATVLGTALATAGSSAMNQLLERRPDARMTRTADRPLAAGRMKTAHAIRFILPASVVGIAVQAAAGFLAAGLLTLAWLTYVLVYTPLKRKTPWAVLVGAVPGALPILVGWSASGRPINGQALTLFAIMFVWQVPHFLSIAWRYRADYERAGFRVAAAGEGAGRRTFLAAIVCCAVLIPTSLLPALTHLAGHWYYLAALVAGFAFLAFGLELARIKSQPADRQLMLASLVYLPVLFLMLMLDKVSPP